MATTVASSRTRASSVEALSLGGRPASHPLRSAQDTTERLVQHVLTTTECRDLTDDAGRGAVKDIAERCVALAADVLDSGRQPSAAELGRLVEEAEEGCVLRQERLELPQAHRGPVLDPGLGEVVCDGVQSSIHARMIDIEPIGYMGRMAYLVDRPDLPR